MLIAQLSPRQGEGRSGCVVIFGRAPAAGCDCLAISLEAELLQPRRVDHVLVSAGVKQEADGLAPVQPYFEHNVTALHGERYRRRAGLQESVRRAWFSGFESSARNAPLEAQRGLPPLVVRLIGLADIDPMGRSDSGGLEPLIIGRRDFAIVARPYRCHWQPGGCVDVPGHGYATSRRCAEQVQLPLNTVAPHSMAKNVVRPPQA